MWFLRCNQPVEDTENNTFVLLVVLARLRITGPFDGNSTSVDFPLDEPVMRRNGVFFVVSQISCCTKNRVAVDLGRNDAHEM